MKQQEQKSTADQLRDLAEQILRYARESIVVNFRYLDAALFYMKIHCVPGYHAVGMDGQMIAYDPRQVLLEYKEDRNNINRLYLHMVFHCIFYHPFNYEKLDQMLWDIASDIAVEHAINQLGIHGVTTARDGKQEREIAKIAEQVGAITAERVYHYLLQQNLDDTGRLRIGRLFARDDHSIWGHSQKESGEQDESGDGEVPTPLPQGGESSKALDDWRKMSESIQTDLETTSKKIGDQAGDLTQNLRACNREHYDYTDFLRRFATLGEVIQIDNDSFDYVFYTYGLQLYDNMPLIEPLEYREVKRIKEFVIAIDTSGSVEGELVQQFVMKTYNILKQSENFFTKINLHIIQCDAEIQEDVKITCQEEFDRYLETMELHGFGGTDFRPVFDYVDALCAQQEFTNLKGLIYFTDGYGQYPKKKPDYDTAFVFLDDVCEEIEVPVWAIKLVLERSEIK
ncbi:MAG: VWA-like domain-containing protein [Oscillospiraceae bacterium]|jgi:predicted metal-dependent peptidase